MGGAWIANDRDLRLFVECCFDVGKSLNCVLFFDTLAALDLKRCGHHLREPSHAIGQKLRVGAEY